MNTQKKYIISKSMTFKKTEEELREWAEEIRQNEGLQDVTPDYTEKEWTQDHDLYDEYVKDINTWQCWECNAENTHNIDDFGFCKECLQSQ